MYIPTAQLLQQVSSVKLYDSTLGGAAPNFDVTGIPASYAHLLLLLDARGDTAATTTAALLRFNNDSGANYDYNQMFSFGAAPTQADSQAQTSMIIGDIVAASGTANRSGSIAATIMNYASATFSKNVVAEAAVPRGTTTNDLGVEINMGTWRTTSAVDRITILPGAGNFATGSRLTIYAFT